MTTVSTSEIVKKPRLISAPGDVTLIEDARKHEPRSVLLPYDLYLRIKEKIEDEVYLYNNAKALSGTFDEAEEVVEEIIRD